MKAEDYAQGDAFQAEKRTIFSNEWLPVCADAQIAKPGDFLSATVGGWSVVAVCDKAGEARVLRNACRHQNMPVVGTPRAMRELPLPLPWLDLRSRRQIPGRAAAGGAARSHGGSRLAVARHDARGGPAVLQPGHARRTAQAWRAAGLWRHALDRHRLQLEVAVEHLLGEQREGSPTSPGIGRCSRCAARLARHRRADRAAHLPAHALLTHVFGGAADEHKQAAGTIRHVCERLQADRVQAPCRGCGRLIAEFHRRLAHP